jgi:hypothetical protein
MDEHTEKLYEAAKRGTDVLLKVETVFPFTLFPDTITIDREKLNIAHRDFFKVAKISGTPLADIESVDANVGPFFGSLRITSRFFVNNTRRVRFLTREDALKVQQLLQGYKLTKEKKIELRMIETKELVRMLMELGEGHTD